MLDEASRKGFKGAMSSFPVDIESESVQFEDAWFTRDQLAQHIRSMLESGNFNVARPGQALEFLNGAISDLRTLVVRVSGQMAEALQQAASARRVSVAELVREAVATSLANEPAEPVGASPLPAEAPAPTAATAAAATPVAAPTTARPSERINSPLGLPTQAQPSKDRIEPELERRWFGA